MKLVTTELVREAPGPSPEAWDFFTQNLLKKYRTWTLGVVGLSPRNDYGLRPMTSNKINRQRNSCLTSEADTIVV